MKKNILILVLSNLSHDARVRRQIKALIDTYAVTAACYDGESDPGVNLIRFEPTRLTFLRKALASILLLLRLYPHAYRLLHNYSDLLKKISPLQFDLIIANDVETLPLAFSISDQAKILFDAHEYAPRHFEDKWMWRIFFQRFNNWLCERYIRRVSAMTTVSRGLAEAYEKNFGVKPLIITNATNYFSIEPSPVSIDSIKLIHHGIATRSRNLELMIEMMDKLDERFTLDFMLLVPGSASSSTISYLNELKKLASRNPRIKFVPPVKSTEIVRTINKYDMGVFLLPPINFNYANTLPNKLFDFIQARLAIAVGPTPEMAEIVDDQHNGVVAENFTPQSLAKKLNSLTRTDIEVFKSNSDKAARVFNAEKNIVILKGLIRQLLYK